MSQVTPALPGLGVETTAPGPATMCRLTVALDGRQVDVSVPADIPIALVLPDVVSLASNGNDHSTAGLTLARIGQPGLRSDRSLAAHGVTNGELLILTSTSASVAPIVDDVASALSLDDLTRTSAWSSATRLAVTWVSASMLLVSACVTLVWSTQDVAIRAGAAFGTSVVLLICCAVAARSSRTDALAPVLGAGAALLSFTGGIILIADPRAGGLLFGCTLAGAVAAITVRMSRRGESVLAALAFAAVLAAPAALLGTLTTQPPSTLAATMTITGLIGLTLAGRLAVSLGRLPLPVMPGPLAGEPDPEPDLPSLGSLQGAARSADAFLAGLVGAAAFVIAVGAGWCAIGARDISWSGVALAGVAALVLALRGRTYTAAAPAAAVLAGSTGLVVALAIGIAARTELTLVAFGIAIGGAVAAVVFGAVIPGRQFSPPVRRSVEILELVAIAAAVPLACWVAGLYDALTLR